MFRMFKRLFRAFAGLSSAFSKTARSLEHIASATEELSESLLIEERLRRQARIEELRRQIAATQLDPPVSIKSDRLQSTRPTKHTAPQTEPCLGREQQFAPAPIVVEVQRTLIRKQPCGKATDDSPSGGPAEAPYAHAIGRVESLEAGPIEDDRKSYSPPTARSKRASLGAGEARAIQELVAQRGIRYLVHFTREANLPSILARGLVTRDVLHAEGQENNCDDRYRLDGTDAVCASIEFPNYKMFFARRQAHKNVDWILLTIDPSILWTTTVAFCTANAASKMVTQTPLRERVGVEAMKAMFADFDGKARAVLNLPDSFPTNPQAEVLLLEGVPRQYISGAIALNGVQKTRIEAHHAGLNVVSNTSWYQWRSDYEHWR